jgi:hypothetical protein
MQLWKWDLVLSNRWARVAQCMQLLNILVELAEDANEDKEQRVCVCVYYCSAVVCVCVFITAVPTLDECVCVFIAVVPITMLFAWG